MKKTLLIGSLFLFSISSFAQKDFQLGLRVAPNIGWIKPETKDVESDGLKFGFNYGIVGDFNIADNYSISTGINFVNIGGKLIMPDVKEISTSGSGGTTTTTEFGKTTADIRLKYIEIPITLKLKTNEIGYMKYFGQFGLGLGINYDAQADEEFDYPTNNGSSISFEEEDYGDEINLIRGSLIVGLGAEYNLSGNTSLIFGLTFNNGFTNIMSEKTYQADGNGNAANVNGTGAQKDRSLKAVNNYLLFNFGVLF
jgi:hypothetical protein